MFPFLPCHAQLPPVGQWCFVFWAGHEFEWLRARLETPQLWEIDSRQDCYPSHIEVSRELVTHWMPEPPSPFDVLPPPEVVDDIVEQITTPRRLDDRRGPRQLPKS